MNNPHLASFIKWYQDPMETYIGFIKNFCYIPKLMVDKIRCSDLVLYCIDSR